MRKDHVITIEFDQGRPGTWPNGEPASVREAYDAQLAQQDTENKNS
ncbi:hypothetical protein GCM10010106_30940 [Thermopolyspora flexuosa]|jgi:hypothetical protein|uniref:Uncharacterized protein n=1 Tax=Thermopolyspora flexuosa TaxID=103836 RepID=A0A543ISM8_9ACTN|nr:hypothetical protein [Thermopolyspora flexuosa]TQM73547.1 hypothetical protein FHX40_0194 [Thermopolyspora flexuosa]GGM82123.1 hypothetical protein GCM10010106_30940 [Thermopolyspora flexuosa]